MFRENIGLSRAQRAYRHRRQIERSIKAAGLQSVEEMTKITDGKSQLKI